MKNLIFTTICLLLILSSLHVYSQKSTSSCNEVYGKWKTYYIQEPFGVDPKDKSEIWIFNEDGTFTIDGKMNKYSVDNDCSKLIIEGHLNFFSIEIRKDTLFMTKRILKHESYNLRLKKIN